MACVIFWKQLIELKTMFDMRFPDTIACRMHCIIQREKSWSIDCVIDAYLWTVLGSQCVTPPHDICFCNPVFLVAYCIAPSYSSPYGTRQGSEPGRDARIKPTEHTIGQEAGELQSPRHDSTSSETLWMADELEPSGLHSYRHTHPMSRNIRRLREISDSLFTEGDSLFNTYVSMQCYEIFSDRCKMDSPCPSARWSIRGWPGVKFGSVTFVNVVYILFENQSFYSVSVFLACGNVLISIHCGSRWQLQEAY